MENYKNTPSLDLDAPYGLPHWRWSTIGWASYASRYDRTRCSSIVRRRGELIRGVCTSLALVRWWRPERETRKVVLVEVVIIIWWKAVIQVKADFQNAYERMNSPACMIPGCMY